MSMYTLIQIFHDVDVQPTWNSHLFQLVDVHVVRRKHPTQLVYCKVNRIENALHEMNRRRSQSRVEVIWDLEIFAFIYFADSADGQYHIPQAASPPVLYTKEIKKNKHTYLQAPSHPHTAHEPEH